MPLFLSYTLQRVGFDDRGNVVSDLKHHIGAATGQRVYEYVDDEGHAYYSFYRHPHNVTEPRRLFLVSRVGVHIINFIVALKRRYEGKKPNEQR